MNTSYIPEDQDPSDVDVLAGEYVLGVLDASDRRRAEQLIEQEPAFAAEVSLWESRLVSLASEIAPVPVPDYVWARISSDLGLAQAPRRGPVSEPESGSFWQKLGFWRLLTAGGFATAAVFLFALLNVVRAPESAAPMAPPVVAVPEPVKPAGPTEMASTLTEENGAPSYVATMDAATGRITVTPLQPPTDDDLVPELWLIPTDGVARSLGVFDETASQSSKIPQEYVELLSTEAILAITLEPPGGAPGGKATGPVVAKGGIQLLAMAP